MYKYSTMLLFFFFFSDEIMYNFEEADLQHCSPTSQLPTLSLVVRSDPQDYHVLKFILYMTQSDK